MPKATLRALSLASIVCIAFTSLACEPIPIKAKAPKYQASTFAPTPSMGVNLEGIADWMRTRMFVDVMKQARPFGTAANIGDYNAKKDANGWPLEDAGLYVLTTDPLFSIGGTYKLTLTGTAQVEPVNCQFTVKNYQFDSVKNVTSADIVIPTSANMLAMRFVKTKGGVKNVRLIRPGYPADTTQIFTNEMRKAIEPFSVIRFMDLLSTNNYGGAKVEPWHSYPKMLDWKARRPEAYATQAPTDWDVSGAYTSNFPGMSWEYVPMIANETKKDAWINLPVDATDDYIRQVATLMKSRLNPGLNLYVEYSNEVWNWMFPQTSWNLAAAKAEVAKGNSNLNWDGDTNDGNWAPRRYARRSMEISNIFRSVYGDSAMNQNVRMVLAGQTGAWGHQLGLDYVAANYGDPKRYFYAVAHAPYMDIDRDKEDEQTKTANTCLANLRVYSDTVNRNSNLLLKRLATWYGLKMLAYEGGSHLVGTLNFESKLAANRSPNMRAVMERDLLQNYFGFGGDVYMYFTLCSPFSEHGFWGLSERIEDTNSPKWQAVRTVMNSGMPKANGGIALPLNVGQSGSFFVSNQNAGFGFVSPTGEPTFYLLRGTPGATYEVSLAVDSNGSLNAKAEFFLNRKSIGIVSVPAEKGGTSKPITVTTASEWNTLALKCPKTSDGFMGNRFIVKRVK